MTDEASAVVAPAAEDDAAGAAALSAVDALVVTAHRLEWIGARFVVSGGVTVSFGDQQLVAASGEGTAEELTLLSGVWTRPEGTIHFDRAAIRLRDRTGVATGVVLAVGDARVTASELAAEGQGRLSATDAVLEPCRCTDGKPAAVRFVARRITVLDAEVAVVQGGSVRIFTVPVIPVPYWRVQLDPKRFRMLLPEVGYGEPGVSARWHGRGGLGPWWIEGGPAFREDRGLRGELVVEGPLRTHGELGWDSETSTIRGALATEGGVAGVGAGMPVDRGTRAALGERAAVDLTVLSDPDYADDYGIAYVDRGVPYRESRFLGQVRGFRLEGWLPDDSDTATNVVFARFRPEWASGGMAIAPWIGAGTDLVEGEARAMAALGLDARASGTWRFLHGEARATGALPIRDEGTGSYSLGDDRSFATETRLELPMWTESTWGRTLFWPGVLARAGLESAGLTLDSRLGPSLRAETALGGVIGMATVAAGWDGDEWTPEATGDVVGDGVRLRGQWAPGLQGADLTVGKDLSLRIGALHETEMDAWFGWTETSIRVGRFVTGVGVSVDPDAEGDDPLRLPVGDGAIALNGASARVGYDDGCSSFLLTAALSPDRELPDFGAQIVLRK